MKLHFSNIIKIVLILYHWTFLTLVTRVDSFAYFLVSGLNLFMMTLIITLLYCERLLLVKGDGSSKNK